MTAASEAGWWIAKDGCGKRCFTSVKAARAAHKRARFRVRIYFCLACCAWHATNQDKHAHDGGGPRRALRKKRRVE